MPHYGHHAAVFVVYTWATQADDEDVIAPALERIPDPVRSLVVGPVGGINGYRSLALLPSGGRTGDEDEAFRVVLDALVETVGADQVEFVRFRFGADDERVIALGSSYPWHLAGEGE